MLCPIRIKKCLKPRLHGIFGRNNTGLQSNKMISNENSSYMEFITTLETRMRMQLPPVIEQQLEFEEYTIKKEHQSAPKHRKKKRVHLTDEYVEAFNKLSKSERIDLYKTRIAILAQLFNKTLRKPSQQQVKVIDVYVQGGTLLSTWKQKLIQVNPRQTHLSLCKVTKDNKDSKTKTHDLRNYIYRKSKNTEYFSFVLEAVNSKPKGKYATLHLGFSNLNQFNIIYQEVKDAIEYGIALSYANELGISLAEIERSEVGSPVSISQDEPSYQQKLRLKKQSDLKKVEGGEKPQESELITKIMQQSIELKSLQEIKVQQSSARPAIIQQLLPEFNLNTLPLQDNMTEVEAGTNYRLLQGRTDKKHFKLFLTIPTDAQKIFSCIGNVQDLKKSNTQIQEISVKNVIRSENTAVIYMKLRNYSAIYRGRDFLFLRHVFKAGKTLYIVEKSIQNIDYPPFMTIVRGSLTAVWCIVQNEEAKKTLLILNATIDNEGILNEQQNMNLSVRYLSRFYQLQKYIDQKSKKGEEFSAQLFDASWQVQLPKQKLDKIENFQQILQKKPSAEQTKQEQRTQEQSPTKQTKVLQEQEQKGQTELISKSDSNLWTPQLDKQGRSVINWGCLGVQHKMSPWKQALKYDQSFRQHHIWKGEWKHDDEAGGLWYKDEVKMNAQKKILGYLVRKMGSNLIQGKGILNISLPVDIFSMQSNLERVARTFVYAPLILQNAANMQDPVAQLKQVIIVSLTHSLLYMSMQKPFNPVLGQTFQGSINGCPIFLQQISHHPPIAAFYFVGRGYKIYGCIQSKMQIGINKGTGINEGDYVVEFTNGTIVKFRTPGGEISGLTVGDRKLNLVDKAFYWSPNRDLMLEVVYNPDKKGFLSFGKQKTPTDYFQGVIKKVKRQYIQKFEAQREKMGPSQKDTLQQCSKVQGIWTREVIVDGRTIFNIDKQKYLKFEYEPNPLPSDANYRQDIVYRRLGNIPRSQNEKQRIQVRQRQDRQLRQKFRKAYG